MAKELDIEETSGEILWADVRERLGLSVSCLRSIRQRFGPVLGLPTSKKVPKNLLPAISLVNDLRNMGVDDKTIEDKLLKGRDEQGWPEEVLRRMETLEEREEIGEETSEETIESFRALDEKGDRSKTASPLEEMAEATVQMASSLSPGILAQNESVPSETKILNMFLDLRREMATHEASQRYEVQRLNYVIQKLQQEIRDLRYALILAGGRRQRKDGRKSALRLLL